MPLDPNIAGFLKFLADSGAPALSAGSPVEARAAIATLMAMRDQSTLPPVASIEDLTVAGSVPARVYRPDASGPRPTIVYLHGGGFVIGDVETHDGVCRQLCSDVSAVVISVDYRLAPEHPFPAAVDDCWAALKWVAENVDDFGGDADRLVVGGDSAGGNLAAVCAQLAHAAGLPLAAQLLVYPATDVDGEYQSRVDNVEGYFLTVADMEWFFSHYTGVVAGSEAAAHPAVLEQARDPRLSPLHATSLEGLAPALVATAEFDPLRDEGDAYAAALSAAGVHVEHLQFPGLIHGFYGLEMLSPAIAKATEKINNTLRTMLG